MKLLLQSLSVLSVLVVAALWLSTRREHSTPEPVTRQNHLSRARECEEMIEELRSLSDEPSAETLKTIEQIEEQRDEHVRKAETLK